MSIVLDEELRGFRMEDDELDEIDPDAGTDGELDDDDGLDDEESADDEE